MAQWTASPSTDTSDAHQTAAGMQWARLNVEMAQAELQA